MGRTRPKLEKRQRIRDPAGRATGRRQNPGPGPAAAAGCRSGPSGGGLVAVQCGDWAGLGAASLIASKSYEYNRGQLSRHAAAGF
jgi:hypothetical protein